MKKKETDEHTSNNYIFLERLKNSHPPTHPHTHTHTTRTHTGQSHTHTHTRTRTHTHRHIYTQAHTHTYTNSWTFIKILRCIICTHTTHANTLTQRNPTYFHLLVFVVDARHTAHKNDFTLLDCIFHKQSKTFYVLDILIWNSISLYENDTEFRFVGKFGEMHCCWPYSLSLLCVCLCVLCLSLSYARTCRAQA